MFQNYLCTPPRSSQRARNTPGGIFSGRHKANGRFYEDYYSKRTSEEDHEGPAEQCESEPSSGIEEVKKSPTYQAQYGSYNKKAQAAVSGIVAKGKQSKVLEVSSEGKGESEEEQQGDRGTIVKSDSNDGQQDDCEARPFKIVPSLSSKRSVPRNRTEKLKVKKSYSLFSRAYSLKDDDTSGIDFSTQNDGDDEDEVFRTGTNRGQQQGHAYRPAQRVPLNKQLEERLKEKRKVERDQRRMAAAEKVAARAQKINRKGPHSREKAMPMAAKFGSNSSKPASRRRRIPTAVVVIDTGNITFSQYQRLGTPIDLTRSDSGTEVSEYRRYD